MRAVVMERGSLRVETLPDPEPQKGEVLVRSRACGICGSDLHAARHTEEFYEASVRDPGPFSLTTLEPIVMGHEFCVEVLDYGPQTERSLKPGSLVCSIPLLWRDFQAIGYSPNTPGAFAEQLLLSADLMLPVPNGTSAELAALTEPLAVGMHAVAKAGLAGREAALVLGCGPVGLVTIACLKHRGIEPVVAADFSPKRRELASQMGADVVVDPASSSPYEDAALARTGELVVFECVGVPGVLQQVFSGAPANSRVVIVGVCMQDDSIRALPAINKELNLQFVLGYSREEFAESLQLISSGKIDVAPLITGQVGLDQVESAFDALADPETHAKIIVTP